MTRCKFIEPIEVFEYRFTTTTDGYINEKAIVAVQGKHPFLNLDKTNYPKSLSKKDYFNLKEEDQVNDYYEVYLTVRRDPFFVTAETFEPILGNI